MVRRALVTIDLPVQLGYARRDNRSSTVDGGVGVRLGGAHSVRRGSGTVRADTAASALARRRRRRGRRVSARGWLTIVGGALVLCVLGLFAWAKADGGWKSLGLHVMGRALQVVGPRGTGPVVRVAAQEPITVLVMGTEAQTVTGVTNGPNLTDSMMVMGLNPATHTASLLSVPRDLWVNIPGYGPQRINTALEFTGVRGVELTVEKYIGVPVEYYALVNYNALVNLVNDVGGINVDVPLPINDTCYPNAAENKCTTFVLSAGMHHMNGTTALQFARERHSFQDGDIQRQRDQQLVLLALKQALLQPQTLPKLPKIIGALESLVQTNLPPQDIPQLAAEALKIPAASIQHGVCDYTSGCVTNYTTSGGAEVLLLHSSASQQIVRQTFGDILGPMDQYTVQVEDGTAPAAGPYFTGVLQTMGVQTLAPTAFAAANLKSNAVYVNTAVLHLKNGQALPPEAVMLGQMLGTQAKTLQLPGSQAQIVVELGANFPSVAS